MTDHPNTIQTEELPARSPALMLWPEVMAHTTLSKTVIQRLMKRDDFPTPIQLSPNRVAWRRADIEGWLDTRVAS